MGRKKRMDRKRRGDFRFSGRKSGFGCFTKDWFRMRKLTPRDWSGIELEEVKKDFYQEHPKVKARDEAAIKEYMDQNRISVSKGRDCPKPVEAFDEFCFPDCIMDAIKALNFAKPTAIQSQGIPVALSGKDMVGIADTGSGKTLAFILPAITHVLGNNHHRNVGEPEVVVLAPTRELAQQIHQVVVSLGPNINVKSECLYGGSKRTDQVILTESVFEICIATPGRMVDFLMEGLVKLHRCTYFVLDEADKMLDMGFEPQINDIIMQSRPDRQMLMFSATWPQEIQSLAGKYLKDYIRVNIGSLQISANHNITQKLEFCEDAEKPLRIVQVMKQVMKEQENKTLIFVNSKLDVDILTMKFRVNGWAAMGLHGSKKQTERDQVFRDFKSGKISILIATDLAARGLDVDDIKYIVNYDFPFGSENYIHRIGRTGRCDRKGTAITFLKGNDRGYAKKLILVLEEAGQYVPPQLRNMATLPPIDKKASKVPLEEKLQRRQLKRIFVRGDANAVPLGQETNTDSLPDLEDILDPGAAEAANAKKKKNKKKIQLLRSEMLVEMDNNQPKSNKIAKTAKGGDVSHPNPSNRFTDNYYSDHFDNPHWAPSAASQKYGENSKTTPVTGSVNVQNPNLDMRDMRACHNFEMPFGNTPMSAGVRKGNDGYSADNRYTTMPVSSRNYETYVGPRTMEPSMNTVGMRMSMGPVNTRMPANVGNAGTGMNLRGVQPSFSARHEMRGSFNQNNVGWNRAPAERSPAYNNYTDHQASNWRPYNRNNYSTNRMNMNCYPGQNMSGRSGYSQY